MLPAKGWTVPSNPTRQTICAVMKGADPDHINAGTARTAGNDEPPSNIGAEDVSGATELMQAVVGRSLSRNSRPVVIGVFEPPGDPVFQVLSQVLAEKSGKPRLSTVGHFSEHTRALQACIGSYASPALCPRRYQARQVHCEPRDAALSGELNEHGGSCPVVSVEPICRSVLSCILPPSAAGVTAAGHFWDQKRSHATKPVRKKKSLARSF